MYFFRVHRKTFHRHLHSRSSSLEAEKDEETSSTSSEYSYQSSQFAGFTLGAAIVWYSITDTVKADQGESNKSTFENIVISFPKIKQTNSDYNNEHYK